MTNKRNLKAAIINGAIIITDGKKHVQNFTFENMPYLHFEDDGTTWCEIYGKKMVLNEETGFFEEVDELKERILKGDMDAVKQVLNYKEMVEGVAKHLGIMPSIIDGKLKTAQELLDERSKLSERAFYGVLKSFGFSEEAEPSIKLHFTGSIYHENMDDPMKKIIKTKIQDVDEFIKLINNYRDAVLERNKRQEWNMYNYYEFKFRITYLDEELHQSWFSDSMEPIGEIMNKLKFIKAFARGFSKAKENEPFKVGVDLAFKPENIVKPRAVYYTYDITVNDGKGKYFNNEGKSGDKYILAKSIEDTIDFTKNKFDYDIDVLSLSVDLKKRYLDNDEVIEKIEFDTYDEAFGREGHYRYKLEQVISKIYELHSTIADATKSDTPLLMYPPSRKHPF